VEAAPGVVAISPSSAATDQREAKRLNEVYKGLIGVSNIGVRIEYAVKVVGKEVKAGIQVAGLSHKEAIEKAGGTLGGAIKDAVRDAREHGIVINSDSFEKIGENGIEKLANAAMAFVNATFVAFILNVCVHDLPTGQRCLAVILLLASFAGVFAGSSWIWKERSQSQQQQQQQQMGRLE
jgi:hypothetical protein